MKKYIWFFLLFFLLKISAQTDSLAIKPSPKPTFSKNQLYVPLALMASGVAVDGNAPHSFKNQVKDWRNEHLPNFHTHADDFLQFAPLAATYAFELSGMQAKTDLNNRTAIMVKSQIFALGSVFILKKMLHETRPDGTLYSFPSGHTTEAFAGAALLSTEYSENYPWVPYAAYGAASTVGLMRIANNRHYISDVLFGAGLGILSTKIAYWTHHYRWKKRQ